MPSRLNSGRGPRLSVLKRQPSCKLVEIRRVDLIERRVAGVAGVAAVAAPFAVLGAGLRERGEGCDDACDQDSSADLDGCIRFTTSGYYRPRRALPAMERSTLLKSL